MQPEAFVDCIITEVCRVGYIEINDVFAIVKARWVRCRRRAESNSNKSPFVHSSTDPPIFCEMKNSLSALLIMRCAGEFSDVTAGMEQEGAA